MPIRAFSGLTDKFMVVLLLIFMAIGYRHSQVPSGKRHAKLEVDRRRQYQGAAEEKEQQQISSENVVLFPVRHGIGHEGEKKQ